MLAIRFAVLFVLATLTTPLAAEVATYEQGKTVSQMTGPIVLAVLLVWSYQRQ